MLHFGMNMPYVLMVFYGSIMIAAVLLLRILLKNRLPKFVFPVLWGLVLLRFLIPFSLSSPLSLPVPSAFFQALGISLSGTLGESALLDEDTAIAGIAEEKDLQLQAVGTADVTGVDKGRVLEQVGIITEGVGETVAEYGYEDSYAEGVFSLHPNMGPALLPVWLLGFAAAAGILGWQKYCYSRKLRSGLLMEHNETVNVMLREMGMGHVLVFTSDEIASPLVCGLLNPRIYLPAGMDFGNTLFLRHILAHETMHIKRRDNWLKCLLLAVVCLNWYNPLVWIMSKCLCADLETACDAAVLGQWDEDERKGYAYSLLAMAVTGGRTTLLYSAFSKTEVEKRVKNILRYKKATAFVLLFSVLFMAGSAAVFAAGGQAPFSPYLTSFCGSDFSRWGVKVSITRDIALGKNAQKRAEEHVFSILREDETEVPEVIREEIRTALAEEFGVEKSAFDVSLSLCLSREETDREYAAWGLVRGEDGTFLYQGEQVRTYQDIMLGSYQSREKGEVDVSVERNALGEVIAVNAWREGDQEYDRRTEKIEQRRYYEDSFYGISGTAE